MRLWLGLQRVQYVRTGTLLLLRQLHARSALQGRSLSLGQFVSPVQQGLTLLLKEPLLALPVLLLRLPPRERLPVLLIVLLDLIKRLEVVLSVVKEHTRL